MSTLIIRALSHDPQELAYDLQLLAQICRRWGIPEPSLPPLGVPQTVYRVSCASGYFHTLRLADLPAGTSHLDFEIAP